LFRTLHPETNENVKPIKPPGGDNIRRKQRKAELEGLRVSHKAANAEAKASGLATDWTLKWYRIDSSSFRSFFVLRVVLFSYNPGSKLVCSCWEPTFGIGYCLKIYFDIYLQFPLFDFVLKGEIRGVVGLEF
jgi:hypothetical protein